MKQTIDQRISKMKPGDSIEFSRVGSTYVTAERTGNGRKINFVRHTPTGWQVFKTSSF